jgi:hypothetical protein
MRYINKEDYKNNLGVYYFEAFMEVVVSIILWFFWHEEFKRRYPNDKSADSEEGENKT